MQRTNKAKIIALSLLITMIVQMFSPYSILLSKVSAAVNPDTDKLVVVQASDVTTKGSNKIIAVTYAIIGENVASVDFSIKYDPEYIKPAQRGTGNPFTGTTISSTSTSCAEWGELSDNFDTDTRKHTPASNTIRIALSEPGGGKIDLDPSSGAGTDYNYYMSIVTLYFYVVKPGLTKLTPDMLSWAPAGSGLPTGYKYIYNNGGSNITTVDTNTVVYEGFEEAKKAVDRIEVTKNPTDVTYKNGEKLNFTGGTITIYYDDGSKDENQSIVDKLKDGTFTVDTEYASSTTKKAVITCSGKTVDIPYYVLSGAELKTNPSKTTYNHGDTINFAGGELNAIFSNSSGATIKEAVSIQAGITNNTIRTNTTTANVNRNPVVLTYEGYNVNLPLTVNDPIDHIAVTKSPNKIIYNQDDNISFEGGQITAYTKSGATTVIPSTDAGITVNTTKADINQVPADDRWTTTTGTQAGTQAVTVSYQGKSATYNITVNDTIDTINVTKQPTAKNKYGATNLDFAGLKVTVNTRGGGTFEVDHNSVSIDTSSYNPNTLDRQEFTVSYGGKTSTTKAQITLEDYITDITPSFTNTTFDYNTPLSTILNGATFVKNYASGNTSTPEAITTGMISGYTQKPSPTLFNTSHENKQNLSIKLASGSSSFDQVPITKKQEITIKDTISSIVVEKLPTNVGFEYGDSFEATNGKIKTVYASGAPGESIYMSDPSVKLTQTDKTTAVTTEVVKSKFNNGQAKETVLVTYTKDGKSYETNYQITIYDKITGISITKDPTKKFEHGDTFSTGDGKITVTYAVADPREILMSDPDVMITQTDNSAVNMSPTGYDENHKYVEHLKVDYMDKKATYDIEIANTIEKIELAPSPKTNYAYQESIANAGGNIKITRKDKTTNNVPITDSMITGLNTDTPGTRQATVTYTEDSIPRTITYNYTVANAVVGARIEKPTKDTYNHGEMVADGKLILINADTTETEGSWNDVAITEVDGSTLDMTPTEDQYKAATPKHKVSKTIKFSYSKNGVTATDVTMPINIINDVKSIKMKDTPKTQYSVKEALDVTNGTILVKRAVGVEEEVSITADMVDGFDSSREYPNDSLVLTVSYTENGITPTPTSYNATVTDTVSSVAMGTPPKTDYKYDEALDATGGTLQVTRSSGETETINIGTDMITGYDPKQLGEQELTITYGGIPIKYTVNVKDYVTGIEVSPDTITGAYNTSLADLITNVKYKVTYAKAGEQPEQNLVAGMVAGYNPKSLTTQVLKVTYQDNDANSASKGENFQDDLTITLANAVIGARIEKPTKDTYNHGEMVADGKLILISADNSETEGSWNDVGITEADGSTLDMTPTEDEYKAATPKHKVSKTIKFSYSKDGVTAPDVTMQVYIINDVQSISLTQVPKTNYSVKEALDVTGGKVLVTRAVGNEEINLTTDMVGGFDSTVEHPDDSLVLTVSYTENGISPTPVTYNVAVIDTVSSVTMGTTPKTNYKYDEALDVTGGTLVITRASGETETISIPEDRVSGYDPKKLGEQELTITYGGIPVKYTVNVKDYVTGITVNPNTLTGSCNTRLAKLIEDVKYIVTYAKAGDKPAVDLEPEMVKDYDSQSTAEQTLTVTYTDEDENSATNGKDFEDNITVTLENAVIGAAITAPSKLTYKHGESLAEGTLILTYADGDMKTGNWSDVTVKELDGSPVNMEPTADDYSSSTTPNIVTKTLKINYNKNDVEADEVQCTITIINDVQEISMKTTPKQNYNIGESLEVTGGEILVKRAVGEETIPLTTDMVDGFDSSAEHTDLSLKVEYTENGVTKDTNYLIQVKDDVSNVTLKQTPKTKYKFGEPLDVSTGILEAVRPSGAVEIPMTENMVSGFDPEQLGPQTLTISYGGFTMNYDVEVEDYMTGIVLTPPDKVTYEYGEPLDVTGGSVQKVMASGTPTTPVALDDTTQVTLSAFHPNQEGAQTIYVDYAGETASFAVTVEDNVASIAIENYPKQAYKYGEPLDVTGGSIIATKTSGKTEEIDLTSSMVSGYKPNELGTQTLTITYKEKKASYTVEVEDYVKDIEIQKPNKLIYSIGEELDLSRCNCKISNGKWNSYNPSSYITRHDNRI